MKRSKRNEPPQTRTSTEQTRPSRKRLASRARKRIKTPKLPKFTLIIHVVQPSFVPK